MKYARKLKNTCLVRKYLYITADCTCGHRFCSKLYFQVAALFQNSGVCSSFVFKTVVFATVGLLSSQNIVSGQTMTAVFVGCTARALHHHHN